VNAVGSVCIAAEHYCRHGARCTVLAEHVPWMHAAVGQQFDLRLTASVVLSTQ